MTFKPEVLFVDRAVDDLDTILNGLRPEVEVVVLDGDRRAARQMAQVLEHRRDLDAIHLIAHGAPGRVSFQSGDWTIDSLGRDAADMAVIGRALREGGDLRLWSCETARGAVG